MNESSLELARWVCFWKSLGGKDAALKPTGMYLRRLWKKRTQRASVSSNT
ncbi:MAG: hypothetical protein WAQ53_13505 [Thiofilum sp.]|nr:hypothetical protein [Thiofilum sp.]MBK8453627.1 hypothetical protein [Thiofilum sp.]